MKISICFLSIMMSGFAQNFEYTVDRNLRNKIKKTVWNELKQKTPERERVILNFSFLGNNLFTKYNAAAKAYGYKPENLITATTFLKVISNEIIEERNFSKLEIDQIFKTSKKTLQNSNPLSKDQLQTKSDRQILTAMWLYSLKEMMKDTRALKKMASEYAELISDVQSKTAEAKSQKEKISDESDVNAKHQNNSFEIYDIRMRTIHSYGLSGPYMANRVYVLYKNGDAFKSPVYPLESLDMAASKREKPAKWDRWKQDDGVITLIYKSRGKTKQAAIKKWFDVRPAPKNFRIEGIFETLDPFGGATVIKSKIVYLDKSGRFAWKTVSGGTFSGGSAYHKSKIRGTYTISKHTINFNFENGKKESYFFAIYPDSDKHLIIGRSHFVPRKK